MNSNILKVFRSKPPTASNNDEVMRIVMVGKTGVGKSATGNNILGQKAFKSEFSAISLTKRCEKASGEVDGQKVAVIDTPGLFDTRNTEEETNTDIVQCISYASPGPHIFLVVIKLGRFTDEEKHSVEKIQEIFGEEANKYSMVLFTHSDLLKGKTIKEFLKDSKDLQELVAKCNGWYHVFNNELEDRSQVSELLEKIRNINVNNGGSCYTNEMFQTAERVIEEEKLQILKKKEERNRKEQEEVKKEMEKKYQRKLREMKAEREKDNKLRAAQAEREEEKKRILKEGEERNRKMQEELRKDIEEEYQQWLTDKEAEREEKNKLRAAQAEREEEKQRILKEGEERNRKMQEELRKDIEEEYQQILREFCTKISICSSTPRTTYGNNELIRIVLVGKTGAGKSATGNTILGQKKLKSEFAPKSFTECCEKIYGEVDGQKIAVIDTPGLFDTKNMEGKTVQDFAQSISYASPGPHIFLVVIKLGIYTEEEKQTVEKIQEIFGEEANKYSMVLFTHGDLLKGKPIEKFLNDSKDLQELVAKYNGQYHVFNNELKDHSQVRELFNKIGNINVQNGGNYYTNNMFQKAEEVIEEEKKQILRKREEQNHKEEEELMKKIKEEYQKKLREKEADFEKQTKFMEEREIEIKKEMKKLKENQELQARKEAERNNWIIQLLGPIFSQLLSFSLPFLFGKR